MIDNNTQANGKEPRQAGIWETLGNIWNFLTRPHPAIQELGPRRQAQLLAGLTFLLTLSVINGLFASMAVNGFKLEMSSTLAFLGVFAFTFTSYLFSRSRHYMIGTALLLGAFSVASYMGTYMGVADPLGFALSFLPIAFIIGGVLLSLRGIIILTVSNLLLLALLAVFTQMSMEFASTVGGTVFAYGVLLYTFTNFRNSLEQARLAEKNRANQELQALSTSLEQRVTERTNDILVAVEVGRRIATLQDINELLAQSVEVIRDHFDLYYTQVYLVSPNGNSLIMRAGTGTVGAEFIRIGHRLPIDYTSINGTAAQERKTVTVADTKNSKIFRPHHLLPQTCSEMSVPLLSGDSLLGVLDLQSSEPGALSEKNLPVFEVLAGQLATALVNAGLFERLEHTLAETEAQSRQRVRKGWDEYLDGIHVKERIGYTFDQQEVKPLEGVLDDLPDTWTLKTPIAVAGETVGSFQFVSDRPWKPENEETVRTVVAQVAQQIENLRLLNQAELYRSEAEDAVQRLTRQEWGDFMRSTGAGETGFIYANDGVQPLPEGQDGSDTAMKFDIKIRDEEIGHFGFEGLEAISPEDTELVAAISEQLGAHLENIRLVTNAQQELEERRKAEAIIAKRATELTTVAEVATVVATIQSPEEMLQTVVDLTKVSFDLYHAHIYLLNEAGNMMVLTKGAGEVGRQMVTEGRQIPLQAEKSLVARAARTRQGVIVNDVRQDPEFLPHPLLPDTRSELAVPMVVGDTLLGVLDIQSAEAGRFSDEDISIHTTLASQVAVALQNARQYAQTQESEQLTRTVIDSTPDWIFIKDRQHRFRLTNQGYLNSLHWEMEDVIGKDDIELGFPEELVKGDPEKGIAGFWADDREVMNSGVPKVVPRDLVMVDGKERILNTLKTPLRDANGDVWGVLAFCRDVTEREQTIADTEALYEGSRQLARSQNYRDVLQAVVQHTVLSRYESATLSIFDKPWDEKPQTVTSLAVAGKEGDLMPFKEGMVLPAETFISFYKDSEIHEIIVQDTATDPQIDDVARNTMLNEQGIRSSIMWPLVIGGQTLGMISAVSAHPVEVNETEKRRLSSLIEQAGTMIQSLRLFEAAQARAHREQLLREITARVRNSMDPDTILRTAVRELGNALGRPAFVRVGSAEQLVQKPGQAAQDAQGGNVASQADGEGGM
jgi:PAS domain S-box-containing protein